MTHRPTAASCKRFGAAALGSLVVIVIFFSEARLAIISPVPGTTSSSCAESMSKIWQWWWTSPSLKYTLTGHRDVIAIRRYLFGPDRRASPSRLSIAFLLLIQKVFLTAFVVDQHTLGDHHLLYAG